MTVPKSSYPVSIEDLLPRARKLAATLGKLPSRNQLKAELHIGAPKAAAVYQALNTEPEPSTDEASAARLHLVPDTTTAPIPEPDATPVGADETTPEAAAETTGSVTGTGAETRSATDPAPVDDPATAPATERVSQQIRVDVEPPAGTSSGSGVDGRRGVAGWPVLLLALPAFVAIWSGWVGLGGLTGFGIVHPLPGIADGFSLNTAITLPIGVETYAAYALRVWLSGRVPVRARRFAKRSALGSLALGAAGQVAYHLMTRHDRAVSRDQRERGPGGRPARCR